MVSFYHFIEENDGSNLFTPPVKKTCVLAFENKKSKVTMNLDEDEMKQLVAAMVNGFGLKAVISAVDEAADNDDE